ncbi:intermembrane transport protein PqiB [Aliidiomarina maris]|uniref:Mammalian cell entry protein n=1 Tax=Aliidiomarina maris TaxID=531312 RepID=A0A327WZM1_9GAMM|nr:intermembrane transport protein PqiB [Aliidiomarina maris]RAJ99085.1 paraquat-inducible protein B [Aliidiomarina maris]RUO27754.1 mammalian cell entry protein [Aliidiomarina maris]
MSNPIDDTLDQTFGKARRGRARRISSIWLVPAVALAIGIWMAYDTLSQRGALVHLTMLNAEGVEAGKTMVKVKEVAVGRVESVSLTDDFTQARAAIRMFDGTDNMLTEDAQFWVVKPRVGRDGVSGLGTILSGAYIELEPGIGEPGQRHFETLAQPPVMRRGEAGVSVRLHSDHGNQLNPGDPVTFRGYTVGRIQSAEFNIDNQRNEFRVFIQQPFSDLVSDRVRFWQSSGVSFQLGADGVRIDMGSLESILVGGITFDFLNEGPAGERVAQDTEFTLYRDRESAQQEGFTQYADYIMLVEQSVRGLSVGAPIEFRGIRIGTVLQVPYTGGEGLGQRLMQQEVPVLIRIEPERLGPSFGDLDMQNWQQQMQRAFARGLRAQLQSGNIITGAQFIDLVFSDAPLQLAEHDYDYPLFPMLSGGSGSLESRIAALVDNLNQIDFGAIGEQAERSLTASEQTLQAVEQLSTSLQALMSQPEMQQLPARLQGTLDELERLLSGYSTDAPAYNDATRAIQSLERILSDLEPFAESLGEQPSSILFKRAPAADPQPRREQR